MSHRRAVLTALTLTTAAAIAASPAIAAPSPPAVTEIDVICDAIGADTVTITGDLASGGTATIERGPLKVVGQPGFTGKDSAGRSVAVRPTGQGSVCTAQTPTSGDELADLIPSARANSTTSTGEVDGRLTFTVEVQDTPTPLSQQRSAQVQTSAAASFPFESELRSYLNSRPGAVGVAVRLPGTGRSFTYTKVSSRNVTASIVKVHIMAAVMMKAQDEGRSLSSWEKSQMSPMIRYSDNNSATALFNHIGGRSGLDRAAARLGMNATHADPYNHWGLTSTTAADQAELMEHFARPSDALNQTNRYYALNLMRGISSSQDWGVTAGPPSGSVALKNGWLPRTDGWHVNSIGWAKVSTADYTIGVLTHHNPGNMSTEIATIEGVSRIVYRNRAQLLPPEPPKTRGVKGDFDGDGHGDLIGKSASGRGYVMRGNGASDYGDKELVTTWMSSTTSIGPAGDVNRDGRSEYIARRTDGRLLLMYSSSAGLGNSKELISGWGTSVTSVSGGGDVDGNGRLDVLMRMSSGEVRHYEISDSGGFRRVRSMGTPAVWYDDIHLVSDVNGDGRDDMRGISPGGKMRTWTSTGTGWTQTSHLSEGWDAFSKIAVPGTANGGSQDDVVAVPESGTGRLYRGRAGGGITSTYSTISEYLGSLVIIG
ncbi:FG-GAP-like repeat-containing protein [Janibacter anophelis]|uniref:FG-GAP-like repeat-containing protein n=1 Tax=Janibacter anophelis TaxID=319054 RepID=UPI003F80B448